MNKFIPIALGVLVILTVGFFVFRQGGSSDGGTIASAKTTPSSKSSKQAEGSKGVKSGDELFGEEDYDGDDELLIEKSALELYRTAEEALQAVKQGSLSYDDIVLEQFTNLGPDCSWCDSFYAAVKSMMTSSEINAEQRNYFAEVLAVSGRVENLKTIVEAIQNAPNKETADNFAQALELTVGSDDAVMFLAENFSSTNESLKESAIAAVTNQGSRLAVDLLYEQAKKSGDPDGGYSQGIGLGELVPDDEAIPRLQELMNQRDQYSHLAVKALLNSGHEGLKLVFDSLSSSSNSDFDKEMIKGALDHVSWDDENAALVERTLASTKSELVREFARSIQEEFKQYEDDSGDVE